VDLVTGTSVAALHGTVAVTAVALSDGRVLAADVVVVGIGATPNTGWLAGSALALHDGVLCDDGCVTALPEVVAVGDVARVGGTRAEHWTSATEQPRVAVTNLLAGRTVESLRPVPYFWSDQYGARVQFAGRRQKGDTVRITEGGIADGAPAEDGFLARYERDGRTTAVLSVDRPRPFMRARRELARATAPVQPAAS
jgi:NADPH-dependent 2,4-dienoyl-CoA reductase/sulfur reductase-like enzyme